jgi:ParB-like chromosome segregation protein Spo0J
VLAAVENGQRKNLNPIEEAGDYQGLLDDGYSAAEVADLTGKSVATVKATVRLLRLEAEVKALLIAGDLSKTHGTYLVTVKDRAAQIGLANRAVKRGMTVTTLETACQTYNQRQREVKASPNAAAPAASQKTVPLTKVKIVKLWQPPPPRRLSPEAADFVLALAEESCETCREHGFSAQCLTCDKFTEFATLLIKAANRDYQLPTL